MSLWMAVFAKECCLSFVYPSPPCSSTQKVEQIYRKIFTPSQTVTPPTILGRMKRHERGYFFTCRGLNDYNDEDNDFSEDGQNEDKNDGGAEEGEGDSSSVDFDDLMWRVERVRLEEANTRRFLKAKPKFLPYSECRNWVKAWNRWETKEEWREWINEGEKRNSYIPSRPDEYYGSLGEWRGWDHFLGKE